LFENINLEDQEVDVSRNLKNCLTEVCWKSSLSMGIVQDGTCD